MSVTTHEPSVASRCARSTPPCPPTIPHPAILMMMIWLYEIGTPSTFATIWTNGMAVAKEPVQETSAENSHDVDLI